MTAAQVAAGPFEQPGDDSFLGHPKGLAFLAFTEAWERFSYYGMSALLVLYMVNQLLLPGHIEHVAGFAAFRSMVEGTFGPFRRRRSPHRFSVCTPDSSTSRRCSAASSPTAGSDSAMVS